MNKNTSSLIFIFMLFTAFPVFSTGEGIRELPASPTGVTGKFPITRVTLYTAGLAQMVRETTVFDNETVDFPVNPGDINDILKSLVAEDLDGGIIDTVTFESADPLPVTLSKLRVNPQSSTTLTAFLRGAQGESVTLTTDKGIFSGRILSVEKIIGEGKERRILNIIGENSIRAVDITELLSLKFNDHNLQMELESALKKIAYSRIKSLRTLKISCKGQGRRRIRVSYIKAVPLWKTSYRLVISKEGAVRLEGWALVQNTGMQSWENIKLAFVAGQPNAFTMDLATPKYVARQNLDMGASPPLGQKTYAKAYNPQPSPASKERAYSEVMGRSADDYTEEESYSPVPVVSRAKGIRSGNFYRYDVKNPVTVKAGSSAMIPIILEETKGKPLAVYDPDYDKVFKGVRLINDTDAHWATGPATVLEGRYYGGDTIIPEMIPGSSQILTYAVHGTVEVQKTSDLKPKRITSLKITDGILHRTEKILRSTVYHIKGNKNELILIYPKESGWKLTDSPKVTEETDDEYRFSLENTEESVSINEEYTLLNQFSLDSFGNADLVNYLGWNGISGEMREALEKAARLKQRVSDLRNSIKSLMNRIDRIDQDQERIRENMDVLDRNSGLYIRYSSTLSEQEDELEKISRQITVKQTQLENASKAFKDYIFSLDL